MAEADFRSIYNVECSAPKWQKRVLWTSDFSSGRDVYTDAITFDIEVEVLEDIFKESKYYYIPLGWRERVSFIELDCIANSGQSLQLLPLKERSEYSRRSFEYLCEELEIDISSLPNCIKQHLNQCCQGGGYKEYSCCGDDGHICEHKQQWETLTSDLRFSERLEKLCSLQPLILRASKEIDVSILKIREKKGVRCPKRTIWQTLGGQGWLVLPAYPLSSTTKVVVPNDVRISASVATERSARNNNPAPDNHQEPKLQLCGDGMVGHFQRRGAPAPLYWHFSIMPHRSHLVTPALIILAVALASSLFLLIRQNEGLKADVPASLEQITKSPFLFILVGFYGLILPILYKFSERSYSYKWLMLPQFLMLLMSMLLSLVNFFVPRVVGKLFEMQVFRPGLGHEVWLIVATRATVFCFILITSILFLLLSNRRLQEKIARSGLRRRVR